MVILFLKIIRKLQKEKLFSVKWFEYLKMCYLWLKLFTFKWACRQFLWPPQSPPKMSFHLGGVMGGRDGLCRCVFEATHGTLFWLAVQAALQRLSKHFTGLKIKLAPRAVCEIKFWLQWAFFLLILPRYILSILRAGEVSRLVDNQDAPKSLHAIPNWPWNGREEGSKGAQKESASNEISENLIRE